VIKRLNGRPGDTLQKTAAYGATIGVAGRAAQAVIEGATADAAPHLRWFIEPFGFAQVNRASSDEPRRRGKDMLKIFQEQGFSTIRGIGGVVNFNTGRHEALHRTFVYAPGEKQLAMRMLNFPESSGHAPPKWIPRDVATFCSFNLEIRDAFEYSSTLVDAIAGEKGVFEDIIQSVKNDPKGPKVDLRSDVIAYLEEHCLLISDYVEPIGPESEQTMVAIKMKDDAKSQEKLRESIRRIMLANPNAEPIKIKCFDGQVRTIYEVIEEEEEIEDIKIEGPGGFAPIGILDDDDEEEEAPEEEGPMLPNSAVAVGFGHLMIANDVDILKKVFTTPIPEGPGLAGQTDFERVRKALIDLGSQTDSSQMFARSDQSGRVNYEMIKAGKMPESKSLLGRVLNRLAGEQKKGVSRKQIIDGSKMPDYSVAKPYLGPAGAYVTTEDDGWLIIGVLLKK